MIQSREPMDFSLIKNKYYLYSDDRKEDLHVSIIFNHATNVTIVCIRLDGFEWSETKLKILDIYGEDYEIVTIPANESKVDNSMKIVVNTKITIFPDIPSISDINDIPRIIVYPTKNKAFQEGNSGTIFNCLHLLNPEYSILAFDEIEMREYIKGKNIESEKEDKEWLLHKYDSLCDFDDKKVFFAYCYIYFNGGCYIDDKYIPRRPLRKCINYPCDKLQNRTSEMVVNNHDIIYSSKNAGWLQTSLINFENIINDIKSYNVIIPPIEHDLIDRNVLCTISTLQTKSVCTQNTKLFNDYIVPNHENVNIYFPHIYNVKENSLIIHHSSSESYKVKNNLITNIFNINDPILDDFEYGNVIIGVTSIIQIHPSMYHADQSRCVIKEYDRFIQTIKQLKELKKFYPQATILLLESSYELKKEYKRVLCEYCDYLFIYDDEDTNKWCHTNVNKSLGEMYMMIKLSNILKNEPFTHFIKISGRYSPCFDFEPDTFLGDYPTASYIEGKGRLGRCAYTVLYSIPKFYYNAYIEHFKTWLLSHVNETAEHIFTMFLESMRDITFLPKLNVSGYVARDGKYITL